MKKTTLTLLSVLLLLPLLLFACGDGERTPTPDPDRQGVATDRLLPKNVMAHGTVEILHGSIFSNRCYEWSPELDDGIYDLYARIYDVGYLYAIDAPTVADAGAYLIGESADGEAVISRELQKDGVSYTVMLHTLTDIGRAPLDLYDYLSATDRGDGVQSLDGSGLSARYFYVMGGRGAIGYLLDERTAVSVTASAGHSPTRDLYGELSELADALRFRKMPFDKPYGIERQYGAYTLVNLQRPRYDGILVDDNIHLLYPRTEKRTQPPAFPLGNAIYEGTHYYPTVDLTVHEHRYQGMTFELDDLGALYSLSGLSETKNYKIGGKDEEQIRTELEAAFSPYADFTGASDFEVVVDAEFASGYFCRWSGGGKDIFYAAVSHVPNTLYVLPASDPAIPADDVTETVERYLDDVFTTGTKKWQSYEVKTTANLRYRGMDCLYVRMTVDFGNVSASKTEFIIFRTPTE